MIISLYNSSNKMKSKLHSYFTIVAAVILFLACHGKTATVVMAEKSDLYVNNTFKNENTTDGSGLDNEDPKMELECSLVSKEVDLQQDLNWTYVIVPLVVNVGQCVGTCAAHSGPFKTFHAKIMSLLDLDEQKSCCVPISYADLPIFTMHPEAGFHIDVLPNAIISSCGCSEI